VHMSCQLQPTTNSDTVSEARCFVVCQAQVDALVSTEEHQDGCMALLRALTDHPSQLLRGGKR
jgi:hypothetical protein